MSEAPTPVDVAAGVLIRPDGSFLLASRPSGKPYSSYWEFPGGKVEPGESTAEALRRELHEELAINIGSSYRWVTRVFDYPHALVRLHFRRVFAWNGQLRARERQRFGFFSSHDLPNGPLLPATVPVLKWLQLPPVYAISAVARLGRDVFLRRLESALEHGLRLLQFREPELTPPELSSIFAQVLARARAAGAKLLVSSRHPRALWEQADGVHLTSADLAGFDQRPNVEWVAASTHSRTELRRASAFGADFVVIGPVLRTSTHLDRAPLGWIGTADLIADAELPAYALGGLQPTDVSEAMHHGAHGVASLSAIWNTNQCFSVVGSSGESSDVVSIPTSGPAIE